MDAIVSFAKLTAKVALAVAVIAAVQRHVVAVPVLGPYLPGAK